MNEATAGPDLVYDVGFHDGVDTAFYLRSGHRVVAVDANPEMIRRGEQTFADAIREGRLTLVHGAIAAPGAHEVVTLYVSAQSEWSSLLRSIAGRDNIEVSAIEVPTVTMRELIARFGTPYYVKVDIEGMDDVALRDLASTQNRPTYVSVEAESADDAGTTQDEALGKLALLAQLGYRRFKLVDQDSLRVLSLTDFDLGPRHGFDARVRKLLRRRCERKNVVLLGGKRTTFELGASGPFGEDLAGEWLDDAQARELLVRARDAYFQRDDARVYGFWCDWHAAT